MNRRLIAVAIAVAAGTSGLLVSPAYAAECRTVSGADSSATVCVDEDGTIWCYGRVGDRTIFRCQTA